jgi:lysophospholipase L1-like esterase
MKNIWWLAFVTVMTLLLLEGVLQVGAIVLKQTGRQPLDHWITDHYRILALGDSNTYGIYLSREEAYPAQLQKVWNEEHPDFPIESLNLGHPGQTTEGVLKNLEPMIQVFKPNRILVMAGLNDLIMPMEGDSKSLGQESSTIVLWIQRNSLLYRSIHMAIRTQIAPDEIDSANRLILPKNMDSKSWDQVLGQWIRTKNEDPHFDKIQYGKHEFQVEPIGRRRSDTNLTKNNLSKINERAFQWNIPIHFLTYPANESFYATANKTIREFVHQSNAPFIDLESEMEEHCPRSSKCPDLFFPDLHPKAKGYTLAIEAIQEVFTESLK